jgi:exopolysaccharide production protein ExoZ
MSGKYLVNVQILRFFAALLVVFAHTGVEMSERAQHMGSTFNVPPLFDWGLGVDIFFVISGFIMYYLMHDRFGQPGAAGDFLRRRLIRIVPLYWICTTLMLASILAAGSLINNNGIDIKHIVASYAFFPWPRADHEVFPLLSLGWTLNYEMFFYIVFAVALCGPRRIGLSVMVVLFAVLCVIGSLVPDQMWMLKFLGNSMIGEFLLGIGLAALRVRGYRIPLAASAVFVAVALVLATASFQLSVYEYIWRLITGGLPAILIVSAVVLGPPAGSSRAARWLAIGGDASYALYLTHPFTLKIVSVIGSKLGLPLPLLYWLGLIAAVIASLFVHYLVEKPIGAWLSRATDRPKVEQAAE